MYIQFFTFLFILQRFVNVKRDLAKLINFFKNKVLKIQSTKFGFAVVLKCPTGKQNGTTERMVASMTK